MSTNPLCPECEEPHEMHPYEFEERTGYRCDDCGYQEDWN